MLTGNHLRDPLTQLEMRGAFDAQLHAAVERFQGQDQAFALVVLDIDHFKSVNDAFGHLRGDEVLAEAAGRMVAAVRAGDRVFRIGGDEFALLLWGVSRAEAFALANRLLQAIHREPFAGSPPLSLTISAGVASMPDDGTLVGPIFQAADRRHYQAKRRGRAQVVGDDAEEHAGGLEPPPRPLQRDTALAALRQLLDARDPARALLYLRGPHGSGRTRMLAEARGLATLLGYGTLAIQGTPALRGRLYGALSRALHETPRLMRPGLLPAQIAAALREWHKRRGLRGLLITLDDIDQIDQGTFELLETLFESQGLGRVALVAGSEGASPLDRLARAAPAHEILLTPLDAQGLHTWLRQTLRWEPPPVLAAWLHDQTGGLPGPFWRAVRRLIEARVLQPDGSAWQLADDFQRTTLPDIFDRNSSRPPLKLPTGLPEFIGRAPDIALLRSLLQLHRLVAIVGPGGLGKTRLAIQVAAEVGEQLRDGAIFVPLAGAASIERVLPLISEAAGVTLAEIGALRAALGPRQLLLVLDNIEHLHGIEQIVHELLDGTESLQVLLTSRERPALPHAAVLEMAGMQPPSGSDEAALGSSEAAQLFLRRARQFHPEFALSAEDRPHLARVCRLLEGMPLGIELAAGWAVASSCHTIADRIAENLASLVAERPDIPERHRSVLAVVAAFWSRLSHGEQAMLRRMSVFRGGFSEPAAKAVAQASPFFLGALTTSGYLRRTPEGRFELHELLRQYADAQLRSAARDRRATEARFAAYYAGWVADAQPALLSGGAPLAQLRHESENIVAAWSWAIERKRADLLAQLGPGMARFWELSGQSLAGQRLLEQAIAWLRTCPRDALAEWLLSHLLCRMIWYRCLRNSLAGLELEPLCDEAERAARNSGDPGQLAEALLMRAILYWQRDPERSFGWLEQAELLEASPSLIGELRRFRGNLALLQHDEARSAADFFSALECFSNCNDQLGQTRALINLIEHGLEYEQFASASAYAARTIQAARQAGAVDCEIYAQVLLGNTAAALLDTGEARRLYGEAQRMARATGNPDLEIIALNAWGSLLVREGDLGGAEGLCAEIAAIYTQYTEHDDICYFQLLQGELAIARGAVDEAQRLYEQALAVLAEQRDIRPLCEARTGLVRCRFAAGDLVVALEQTEYLLAEIGRSGLKPMLEPFGACQICWEVLDTAGDARAGSVIAAAHERLSRRAQNIDNPAARASYQARMHKRWPVLTAATPVGKR